MPLQANETTIAPRNSIAAAAFRGHRTIGSFHASAWIARSVAAVVRAPLSKPMIPSAKTAARPGS